MDLIKEMQEYAKTRVTFTLEEYLLLKKNASNSKLFHSVESHDKNGNSLIYLEHFHTEVEDIFMMLHLTRNGTFKEEFIVSYFNAIKSHLHEINLTDDNLAISTFSAAETYFQSIKLPLKHGVSFTPETNTTNLIALVTTDLKNAPNP